MKAFWKFALVSFCAGFASGAEITSIVQKVERWYWYPHEMNVASLSDAERRQAIAELRRRVAGLDFTRSWLHRVLLLRLGDEETMAELVKEIERSDNIGRIREAKGLLAQVKNPVLIPHLAKLLYHPEEVAVSYHDPEQTYYTRPLSAALMIADLIGESRQFSAELKQWLGAMPATLLADTSSGYVQQLQKRYPDTFGMDGLYCITYWCIRQLWEENREAFLRKDYAAVRPPKAVRLPESPAPTKPVPTVPAAAPSATNVAPVPKPPTAPGPRF